MRYLVGGKEELLVLEELTNGLPAEIKSRCISASLISNKKVRLEMRPDKKFSELILPKELENVTEMTAIPSGDNKIVVCIECEKKDGVKFVFMYYDISSGVRIQKESSM